MPRTRRVFFAYHVYEIIVRAREGLPLPTLELIKSLILSAMARTQRDDKVDICHYVWMGNHAHICAVVYDAQSLANFLQELQKKLTESLKRLLGKRHLRVWAGSPVASVIVDPEKAIDKFAYVYANPAKANLVEAIDEYPGLSSWHEFQQLLQHNSVDAQSTRKVPWIRLKNIPKLRSTSVSAEEDAQITAQMFRDSSDNMQELVLKPNAWMKAFGITEPDDIKDVNRRIILSTRIKEIVAKVNRKTIGKDVIGSINLRREPIFKAHEPPPVQRRILVQGSNPVLRARYIWFIKTIAKYAESLFERWKNGSIVKWPPGVFRPPLRPVANFVSMGTV